MNTVRKLIQVFSKIPCHARGLSAGIQILLCSGFRPKIRRNDFSFFGWLLAVLTGCLLIVEVSSAQKKLKVVTTLNYLRYVVQQVGGDNVEAIALANPKQDPHYVTPTPRMNQLATDADLFVENGLSLDLWAKNVVDASGNPKIQPGNPGHLVATINVPIKELPTEISRAWGDIHPQGNPHVWLDPFNVKIVADNIAERLKKLEPANSDLYESRLEAFKERIDEAMFGGELMKVVGKRAGDILTRRARNDELDEWLKSRKLDSKIGGWMKDIARLKGLRVMTYHKTYIYFCDRFGLHIAGELEEKPGIPPPPQYRDAVVEQMKRENIKMIFNDNFYSHEAAE
ncbi:MAG TPA: metal ABC transporter substrate-binding protein, partial [Bacteroidota bacterium]|nr:metal ABC transporter substrate-binding protein [Bacteroidota bacterium]